MNDKELVAQHAAWKIKNGMIIGLGTGSTANYFIKALADRFHNEGLEITTVASSVVSSINAKDHGLPLLALENLTHIDVYVDGADEVAPDLTLLKGRGADLVREKILAKASKSFWVLIDPSKWVDVIGAHYPIPVEVIPFAWQLVKQSLEKIGGKGELRNNANKDGLIVTSHGSLVLDVVFPEDKDSQSLNAILNDIPGIVEHGIFRGLASAVFCGNNGQIEEHCRKATDRGK
jgi:ribose 5-phosphate isomerase A